MKNKIANGLILLAVATVAALVAYLLVATQNYAPAQTIFLAFVAAILAIQLIPALMLFFGMLKGLFSRAQKELEP